MFSSRYVRLQLREGATRLVPDRMTGSCNRRVEVKALFLFEVEATTLS